MLVLRKLFRTIRYFLQKRMLLETATLTDGERLILSYFLESNDPRLRKGWLQWMSAKCYCRNYPQENDSQYQLKWRGSRGCLTHNSIRKRLEMEPIEVVDKITRSRLKFSLPIQPGGWAGPLLGETLDGSPFPLEWKPEPPHPPLAADQRSTLPPRADQLAGQARLEDWLNGVKIDPGLIDFVEFFEPATPAELEQLERRLEITLPDEYRQLLLCSNGLLIGEHFFPGTAEACRPPFPDESYPDSLYLTDDVINNLYDGFYCLPLEGAERHQVVHYDMYGEKEITCDSLKELLKLQIESLPERFLDFCNLTRID
jgi:hypothetical protein